MLSTPPAFNLSQNQTLQFKSVAKIPVGTEIRISKFFPLALHLSMNHSPFSLGARARFYALSFGLSTSFSLFPKISFRRLAEVAAVASALSKTISRRLSRTFFNFATFSRRPVVIPNRRRRTLRRRPLVVKRFFLLFLFFVVLRGEGTPFG